MTMRGGWWMRGARAATLLLTVAAGCREQPLHPLFRTEGGIPRPLLFAHRGGGGLLPEATVPAFQETHRRDPAAVLEFDVQRTVDGHLVVIHDFTLDRTTNGQGPVAAATLAQIQALDAGYCSTPGQGNGTAESGACGAPPQDATRFPFRGQGYRIPTLDEVLAALPPTAFVGIEVKGAGFEKEFARRMRASGRLDRLVVGSEDDDIAVRLKDALPEVAHYLPKGAATCVALSAKLGLDYPGCPEYDLFASPLRGAGLALDTAGILSAVHSRGAVVVYWTINEEPEMERLLRLGADGFFTDFPDRGRRVIDRLQAEGALP